MKGSKNAHNIKDLSTVLTSAQNIMIWTLDKDFRITSFNDIFAKNISEFIGIEVDLGVNFMDKVKPYLGNYFEMVVELFKKAVNGESQQVEIPIHNNIDNVWFETFLNPIKNKEKDGIREILCIAYDTTDNKVMENHIRQSLKEKEILLKELHHRVKNNFQVISSILNLHTFYVKDEHTLDILRESQNRVRTVAFIHESLYQNKTFSNLDFSDYVSNLTNNLVHLYRTKDTFIDVVFEVDEIHLNLNQSIPCGLILNEIITNSLKYAFINREKGQLEIKVKEENKIVNVEISDDGVGLPKDFEEKKEQSLGIQLIYTLTEQLDGEIELISYKGVTYKLSFQKNKVAKWEKSMF